MTDTWGRDAGTPAHTDDGEQRFSSVSAKKVDSAGNEIESITLHKKDTLEEARAALSSPNEGTYYYDDSGLTVHLPDFEENDPAVVITVKTIVTNPAYYGSNAQNQKVYNSAKLETDAGIDVEVGASNTVDSTVLTKSGSYDYDSRTLTWDLTVNGNKMAMTNAVVTDRLPAGTGLAPDAGLTLAGVKLKNSREDPGASILPGTSGSDTPYYTIDYGATNPVLTVHLGDAADRSTKIVEVTENVSYDFLADDNNNQDLTVGNSAALHYHELGAASDPEADASAEIKQSIVEKSGSYNNGTNQLDWVVRINKNQIPAGSLGISDETAEVRLSDALPEGLTLDASSVRLFYLTASDGAWTRGDEITIDRSQAVSYDPDDSTGRTFLFQFPAGTDFSKAYELDFSTDIVAQTADTNYRNEITMQGVKKSPSGTSNQVLVQASSYSGWFTSHSGSVSSIKVVKKDLLDRTTPIPGTTFTLYRNGTALSAAQTGPDGTVTFSNLKLRDSEGNFYQYTVKETAPAAGYQPNSQVWGPYALSAGDPLEALFLDARTGAALSGTVTVNKVLTGGGNAPDGGSFSLTGTDYAGDPVDRTAQVSGGKITFADVPLSEDGGEYTIKELIAPPGCLKTTAELRAKVQYNDGTGRVETVFISGGDTLTDDRAVADISFTKAGEDGTPLGDAGFTLYDAAGNARATVSSDAVTGRVTFPDLALGEYTVRETAAPDGYQKTDGVLYVTVRYRDGAQTAVDALFTDAQGAPLSDQTVVVTNRPADDGNGGDGGGGGREPEPSSSSPAPSAGSSAPSSPTDTSGGPLPQKGGPERQRAFRRGVHPVRRGRESAAEGSHRLRRRDCLPGSSGGPLYGQGDEGARALSALRRGSGRDPPARPEGRLHPAGQTGGKRPGGPRVDAGRQTSEDGRVPRRASRGRVRAAADHRGPRRPPEGPGRKTDETSRQIIMTGRSLRRRRRE